MKITQKQKAIAIIATLVTVLMATAVTAVVMAQTTWYPSACYAGDHIVVKLASHGTLVADGVGYVFAGNVNLGYYSWSLVSQGNEIVVYIWN
jgi:hypothetical protein